MVTLQDIIDTVMLDSGQFIIDFDDTLIDRKILVRIIKQQLQVYNRYFPMVDTGVFNIYNNKTFKEECDGVVPDSIIQIRGNYTNNMYGYLTNGSVAPYNIISTLNWNYTKPILYFNYIQGQYEVKYLVYHKWDDNLKCIKTLDNTFPGTQRYFVDLVTARFMETLGRSRTAFTISGLPVDNNANDLISRGQELYQNTLNDVRENSYFHLAVMV